MARSTRESILTAAAELMRHKGYGAVGMKDIAAGLRRPDRLAVSPLPRRQGADRARGADQRRPRLRTAHPLDRRRVHRPRRRHRRRLHPGGRGHGTAPGSRTCARWPASPPRSPTPSRNSAKPPPRCSRAGSTAAAPTSRARGLDASQAREVTLALIGALEGAFVLARTLRSTEPLLAAGRALAPQYRGVAAGTACRGRRRRIAPVKLSNRCSQKGLTCG